MDISKAVEELVRRQEKELIIKYLTDASDWAKQHSGCTKVSVGSVIVKNKTVISRGANRAIPDLCRTERGCLRVELYGDNSKLHRGPRDCRAIHSEIDAIARTTESLKDTVIFVTRYPCEGCARAIVAAGISVVVYGREQEISDMTKEILSSGGVRWVWADYFKEDDTVL